MTGTLRQMPRRTHAYRQSRIRPISKTKITKLTMKKTRVSSQKRGLGTSASYKS